jgi:hypothetical protein
MARFYFFTFFCRKIALLLVLGRPLFREDGSVIRSAICQWSMSRRTHNHTLLSHLGLLGSLSVASYESQGLRWKYSYPPPHGDQLWEANLYIVTVQATQKTLLPNFFNCCEHDCCGEFLQWPLFIESLFRIGYCIMTSTSFYWPLCSIGPSLAS